MKLRKAIKFAAAGAVVGIAPAISMAGPTSANFDSWTVDPSDDGIVYNCDTVNYSCDTANALGGTGSADPDFYQITITEKATGNQYFQTIHYDAAEGVFKAENFVGVEANTDYSHGGVLSKTFISETQGVLSATDDFNSTAIITSYDWMEAQSDAGATSLRKVYLDQNIAHTSGGATTFNSGFNFKMGTLSDVADSVYEVSTITNGVTDDPTVYAGEYTDTFEQIETKIEGATAYDGLISKTLKAVARIDASSGIPSEAFTQDFVRNEAEGAAVSDSGMVTVGTGPKQTTYTFAAGDTIVALTLDQNVGGAAAQFSLSDSANETAVAAGGTAEAGVDYLNAGIGSFLDATYTGSGTGAAYDPWPNF